MRSIPISSSTHRLGRGLSVTFTRNEQDVRVEWDPDIPTTITPRQLRRYRAARDSFFERLALAAGENWGVFELGENRLRIVGLASTRPGGRA